MEEDNHSSEVPWYAGDDMTTPDEIARGARKNFLLWLEWYCEAVGAESGTGEKLSQEQLAKRLDISGAAISAWRRKGSETFPNLRNLIRFQALASKIWDGVTVDQILFRDTPPRMRK